jgi:HK97 family phage portal protein
LRLFGRDFSFRRKALSAVGGERGGWVRVLESYTGAWQQNVEVNYDSVVANHAIFSCATLIASDIAKLRVKLVEQDDKNPLIWTEVTNPAYTPVLRKPNPYQTRNQFWECWFLSKLLRGNTYVLKARDARGVVTALYILDPAPGRVTPLVSDDGQVFYQLAADNLSGLKQNVIVPAREIIHDRYNCLYHPLVGYSPIFANGLAATQGLNIQNDSASFFGNRSRPSGILTAPGAISTATAATLKENWNTAYSGENSGKIAVLADGLKFEPMKMTAEESQLIEQVKWTSEVIASAFHVPPYKLGLGQMPTSNNVQALNVEYYSQALQGLIEAAETCLDEGLEFKNDKIGTEFDIDNLLRMDSLAQMEVLGKGVGAALIAPNEGRAKLGYAPKPGGESIYLQEQNYSLEALAKRDAMADPFGTDKPAPAAAPAAPETDDPANDNQVQQMAALLAVTKGFQA